MSGIGHNSGRVLEPGRAWRKHVWTKARSQLLPKLPIEVVRLRVKRAKQLGLPYKTYAGIRASSGHDLIGFLFSSNALQVWKAGQAVPQDRLTKLESLVATRKVAIVHGPLDTQAFVPPMDAAHKAPAPLQSWAATRDDLIQVIQREGPSDRFLLIGDTSEERLWAEAAKTAGFLPADHFFSPPIPG